MKKLFIFVLVVCLLFQTAFVQKAHGRLTGTWAYVATGVFVILLYIGILAIEGELAPEPKEQPAEETHAQTLYEEEMRFREEAAAQQDSVVRNFYSKGQSESSKSDGQKDDFVLTLPLGRELLRQARQLCSIYGAPNFTELAAGMLKYESIPACKNYIQLYGEESLDECIKECAYQVVGEFYLSFGGPGDRIARKAESLKELVTGFFQMAKEEALKKISEKNN